MPTAVTPATGRVAAVTKSQDEGSGAAHSAGTTTFSAKAPPDGDRATTRSPTSKLATPSPRATTVPATSQPMTVPGGCFAAVRISPRLTEAASILSRSWPGPGAGSGTSARDRAGEAAGSATSARMAEAYYAGSSTPSPDRPSWSLVLGPVFRAAEGSVLEQAIVLAYPVGDVVLATIVFVVVARIRVGGAPVLLLGAGLLSLAVADSSFAYLTQEGTYATGALSDAGWFAGYLLVAVAARRPAAVGITWVGRRPGRLQALLPYCPLALAVTTSAFQQLRGKPTGPFLYRWFVVLVLLIVGRQLLTVFDNQALHRRLAAMVGELEHQAFNDGLTNLPNRALFRERVAHALRRRSQAGTPLALLFIDLDDFKTVNDQLGHAAGDDLLVAVAGRLKTCIRGEDTVARLGGDEFAILLEQASSHEVAVQVAGRILEAMRPPFPLQGRKVQVGASVGVTVSAATEVDAVLREADVAMYTAKARGKGRFELATSLA
jgi:diguanylate cyclase (GGDEF)-like protein